MSKITKKFLPLNLFLILFVLCFISPSKVLAFSPTDISGLQFWVEADSGVYSDFGKTTNATYSVFNWTDQSGNNRDAITPFPSPFFTTTATSSVCFQANGILQSNWGILTGNATRSIVVEFSLSTSTNQTLLSWGANSSNQLSQVAIWSNAIGYTGYANDLTTSVTPYVDGKLHVLVISFNGTTMNLYIDGVSKGTASKTLNTASSSLILGRSANGSSYFNGSASEVLIYNQGVSLTDAGNLYTYLNSKWGNTSITAPSLPPSLPTSTAPINLNKPVPIIIDTDIATDAGDVGALATLFGLAQLNETNILGIVTDSDNTYSAPAVKAIANWYGNGTTTIPIGAFQGTVAGGSWASYPSSFVSQITSLFGTSGDTRSNYPSALTVYRQALVTASDNSVVILAIGYLNNLRDLLQSPADGISNLSGQQLVVQKVRRLVVMGGDYPFSNSGEWNFRGDPVATNYIMTNWPTEIIASGFSQNGGITAPSSSRNELTDPIKKAYNLHDGGAGTLSWDQVASLYAVRGMSSLHSIGGVSGFNVVNPTTGSNYAIYQNNGLFNYLSTSPATSTLDTTIQSLMNNMPISVTSIFSSVSTSSAIITWDTSSSTDSQVEYGLTSSYTSSTTLDSVHTTSHSVLVSGLSQTTTYHFAVISTNGSGSSVISSDQTFTTISNDDTLSNLVISSGTLTPTFDPGIISYTDSVANNITDITVTPTVNPSFNATIKVNGNTVTSGSESASTTLVTGPNPSAITIVVVAEDGITISTTTIDVTRLSDVSLLNIVKASSSELIVASSTESTTPGDHIIGSRAILIVALAAATATTTDAQSVVDGQTSTLNTAITTYNAAIVPAIGSRHRSINTGISEVLLPSTSFAATTSSSTIIIETSSASSTAIIATLSADIPVKEFTIGSTGVDVTALQQILVNGGYLTMPSGVAYGYYGNLTETAFNKFKLANGFTQSATTSPRQISNSFKFSTYLKLGMKGNDVKELQKYLNNNGFSLSQTGAGSKGKETTYFGILTKNALIKFQENHEKEILIPLGLKKGTGYFGPATIKFINGNY